MTPKTQKIVFELKLWLHNNPCKYNEFLQSQDIPELVLHNLIYEYTEHLSSKGKMAQALDIRCHALKYMDYSTILKHFYNKHYIIS